MQATSSKITISALALLLTASGIAPALAVDETPVPTLNAPTTAAPAAETAPVSPAVKNEVSLPSVPEGQAAPVLKWKPGQTLTTTTDTEDIVATYDLDLAKRQVGAYPDSPEASFILAVALTRTSRVEEALKEVQRARKLAESKGGPVYFDKMIASYEQMLTAYPNDNQVRYGLAWAYYMKAYLLARHSRKIVKWKEAQAQLAAQAKAAPGAVPAATPTAQPIISNDTVKQLLSGKADMGAVAQLATAAQAFAGKQPPPLSSIPHIPSALEKTDPADVPQIRKYYELALQKVDELLTREPDDIWASIYRAHLKAEYTGNLEEAMNTWRKVQAKNPNNPGPYFFLGEGYLKQGNLKESINHVSKAIALRALGN
jgi:tetratricopeptide (TPR) repeat protein